MYDKNKIRNSVFRRWTARRAMAVQI